MEDLEAQIVHQLCPDRTLASVEALMPAVRDKHEEAARKRNKVADAANLLVTNYRCVNCRNADQGLFLEDYKHGQVTCRRCGVVLEDRRVHDGEWKRQFSGDDNPSQHGPAPDPRFSSGHNLRTHISGGSGKGAGSKLSKKELTDLKTFQDRIEMDLSNMTASATDMQRTRIGYKDQQKKKVFMLIDDVGASLHLHEKVVQYAQGLFATYRDALEQVQQRDAVTAACLILALREVTRDGGNALSGRGGGPAAVGSKRKLGDAGDNNRAKKAASYEDMHPFPCKYCTKRFSNAKDRRIHMRACPNKGKAAAAAKAPASSSAGSGASKSSGPSSSSSATKS
ncbi:Transcription initiation factor IIB [Hondaea fermentalgiana]|uniref:General transcription factor TFIIB n=1 Tax=Hondaea fermentalgiana TaxID=2315210 RepID=A0A2R5GAE4_9STRA|nr:Transcription initiation factor IIB [Hondaea fermentalgiana]|eukprot:GBG27987.1 Transcription initiation factor IIB [Hondaea fermentalgiana]